MIRCSKCDHFNLADASVCERCGQALEVAAPAVPRAPGGESINDQVLATAAAGGKIAAIKLYREKTGVGLKDAKEAVEQLLERHHVQAASGCAAAFVFLTVATAAAGAIAARACC